MDDVECFEETYKQRLWDVSTVICNSYTNGLPKLNGQKSVNLSFALASVCMHQGALRCFSFLLDVGLSLTDAHPVPPMNIKIPGCETDIHISKLDNSSIFGMVVIPNFWNEHTLALMDCIRRRGRSSEIQSDSVCYLSYVLPLSCYGDAQERAFSTKLLKKLIEEYGLDPSELVLLNLANKSNDPKMMNALFMFKSSPLVAFCINARLDDSELNHILNALESEFSRRMYGTILASRINQETRFFLKCIADRQFSVADEMIKRGYNVNLAVPNQRKLHTNPLSYQITRNDVDAFEYLASKGASTNTGPPEVRPIHLLFEHTELQECMVLRFLRALVEQSNVVPTGWLMIVYGLEKFSVFEYLIRLPCYHSPRLFHELGMQVDHLYKHMKENSHIQLAETLERMYLDSFEYAKRSSTPPIQVETVGDVIEECCTTEFGLEAVLRLCCNFKSDHDYTPRILIRVYPKLYQLVESQRIQLAKAVLERGAKPSSTKFFKVDPLFNALHLGDAGLVSLLLAHKANPNCKDEKKLATPIWKLVRRDQISCFEVLIKAGASVKYQNPKCLSMDIVEFLVLRKDLDLDTKSKAIDLCSNSPELKGKPLSTQILPRDNKFCELLEQTYMHSARLGYSWTRRESLDRMLTVMLQRSRLIASDFMVMSMERQINRVQLVSNCAAQACKSVVKLAKQTNQDFKRNMHETLKASELWTSLFSKHTTTCSERCTLLKQAKKVYLEKLRLEREQAFKSKFEPVWKQNAERTKARCEHLKQRYLNGLREGREPREASHAVASIPKSKSTKRVKLPSEPVAPCIRTLTLGNLNKLNSKLTKHSNAKEDDTQSVCSANTTSTAAASICTRDAPLPKPTLHLSQRLNQRFDETEEDLEYHAQYALSKGKTTVGAGGCLVHTGLDNFTLVTDATRTVGITAYRACKSASPFSFGQTPEWVLKHRSEKWCRDGSECRLIGCEFRH